MELTNQKFYKITNSDEYHHDHQYKDGLNILTVPFHVYHAGSCVSDGFYFTTLEHIHNFYGLGIYIREIHLPVNDPEFTIVQHEEYWLSNKVILGTRYCLFDFDTYEKLGLDITKNRFIVKHAVRNNRVDFLEKYKKFKQTKPVISHNHVELASQFGCTDVLDWWLKSEQTLIYTNCAIDLASAHGNVNILEWWLNAGLNYGLKLKYSNDSLNYASMNQDFNVLNWWLKSGLKLKYDCTGIDYASERSHINVLNWWLKSGLELKYSENAINNALISDNISVLIWWLKSGLKLKYTNDAINHALSKKYYGALYFCYTIGLFQSKL